MDADDSNFKDCKSDKDSVLPSFYCRKLVDSRPAIKVNSLPVS